MQQKPSNLNLNKLICMSTTSSFNDVFFELRIKKYRRPTVYQSHCNTNTNLAGSLDLLGPTNFAESAPAP